MVNRGHCTQQLLASNPYNRPQVNMVCKVAKTTALVPVKCLVVLRVLVARLMHPFMMPLSLRRFSTAVLNRM